jgi:hypothetical protein
MCAYLQVPEGKIRKCRPHGDAEGQPSDQPRNALAVHLTSSVLMCGPKHPVRIPGPFSSVERLHTPRAFERYCA